MLRVVKRTDIYQQGCNRRRDVKEAYAQCSGSYDVSFAIPLAEAGRADIETVIVAAARLRRRYLHLHYRPTSPDWRVQKSEFETFMHEHVIPLQEEGVLGYVTAIFSYPELGDSTVLLISLFRSDEIPVEQLVPQEQVEHMLSGVGCLFEEEW